jgi:hypothetical protein
MAVPVKTHFSRSGGQQWTDSFYRPNRPTGNELYVHSDGGSSGGYSPETALSTFALSPKPSLGAPL